MSFSSEVKAELCRTALSRRCCAQAEAYGLLGDHIMGSDFSFRIHVTKAPAPLSAARAAP